METVEFVLPTGAVRASVRDGVWDARGVRYASPVVGGAAGDTDAPDRVQDSNSTVFPQASGLLDALLGPALSEPEQSEDSFTLRLQGPTDLAPGEKVPVLLFVPGGGFTTGGGDLRWYDAGGLVRRDRFVLVTLSHRLGAAAGLLEDGADVPGGLAWRDLLAAASWVRAHVAAFGGDPDAVTVAGDSAGAWFAHALSTSPRTRGWFAGTVLVSMPRMAPLSPSDDLRRRSLLASALAEGAPVLEAQGRVSRAWTGQGFPFAPAVCTELPTWLGRPDVSGEHLHTSRLLLISTADEAAAFLRHLPPGTFTAEHLERELAAHVTDVEATREALAPRTGYDAAVALQTWWQFESVVHDLAESVTASGREARALRLDLVSGLPRAGAPHCFTLPFLFGERDAWADAPMLDGVGADEFVRVSRVFADALLAVLRPDVGQSPAPLWRADDPQVAHVDADGVHLRPARRTSVRAPYEEES